MAADAILLGAVAYDPKVVTIWEGMRDVFREAGTPMDFVLFSNYERQVESLLAGHVDIAWNTPLAHVRVQRRTRGRSMSLGMRDSDRDFRAKVLVRRGAGMRTIFDLRGRRLAVGSRDSTQARLLPLWFLELQGLDLSGMILMPFDTDLGKHGDTGTSEMDVLAALREGRADAGTVGDLVWVNEVNAGHVDPNQIEVLYTTPPFDHCMFDARETMSPEQAHRFQQTLFSMQWDEPRHRRVLELEGLKQWMPPRDEGYASLRAALERFDAW